MGRASALFYLLKLSKTIDIFKYFDIMIHMTNDATTVEIFKALADETRLGLVRNLASHAEPVASCDLVQSCAAFLKLSQPAISHHFGRLVDAGVLIEEKHGTQKSYRIDVDLLRANGIDVTKL